MDRRLIIYARSPANAYRDYSRPNDRTATILLYSTKHRQLIARHNARTGLLIADTVDVQPSPNTQRVTTAAGQRIVLWRRYKRFYRPCPRLLLLLGLHSSSNLKALGEFILRETCKKRHERRTSCTPACYVQLTLYLAEVLTVLLQNWFSISVFQKWEISRRYYFQLTYTIRTFNFNDGIRANKAVR